MFDIFSVNIYTPSKLTNIPLKREHSQNGNESSEPKPQFSRGYSLVFTGCTAWVLLSGPRSKVGRYVFTIQTWIGPWVLSLGPSGRCEMTDFPMEKHVIVDTCFMFCIMFTSAIQVDHWTSKQLLYSHKVFKED